MEQSDLIDLQSVLSRQTEELKWDDYHQDSCPGFSDSIFL